MLRGDLNGVRQEILMSTCCRRFRVGYEAAREMGVCLHLKGKLAIFGFVPERTRDHFNQATEEDFFGFDRDSTGFDLRKIKNIADEVEEIGSGAMNGPGELDLLGAVRLRIWVTRRYCFEHEHAGCC